MLLYQVANPGPVGHRFAANAGDAVATFQAGDLCRAAGSHLTDDGGNDRTPGKQADGLQGVLFAEIITQSSQIQGDGALNVVAVFKGDLYAVTIDGMGDQTQDGM